ncbi:M28 family peptidase [Mucilaginibacter sp. L3T2-6]|uniref:M28 family peptidase n=1 Tax=Mucilaginibacter sp. L3T2-6 TaxID=3062491 RepID=UPI002676A08C|nr:M28 family peptidase [Mucilaginibacter sp. L3T2-6]MDO3641222.1 M28 family peptidase [Mucilaginibacter sp. L3T2-6]MDV6214019.1 M28 family peptidase [Mucilaginibacter sp. L3T2-6]
MIRVCKMLPAALLICLVNTSIAQQIKVSSEIQRAFNKIDTAQIKADIAYLADDKLKGRGPGTEGFQMAIDYVTGRLKSLGVKPAGENGAWLQEVKLRKATTGTATAALTTNSTVELKQGTDFNLLPNPSKPEVSLEAPIAFAGYGASEPSLGYDDYAGLDVKGKVVLVVRGAPDKFSSSVMAHTMNPTTILKAAADHGAIGVMICPSDSTSRLGNTRGGQYSVIGKDGSVVISRTFYSDQVKVLGLLSYAVFNGLVNGAGNTISGAVAQMKGGQPSSFPLNGTIKINFTSVYKDIISYNVAGKIEGSDPKLKNEYVVHSAHLDHLGIGRPVEGDSIYNGAHDNASGVASVLAIAGVYHNIKERPKRSILTVLLTGEELGDLGSGYFAAHPTVPVKDIVADVNTDMPTIIAPLLSVTALGAEHSSLAKQVDQAAGYLGLGVEPDPEPRQVRFVRSDQYSFVVNGIPALHIKYGAKTADGKNNLNDYVAKWRAKYYHKPQDDINGIFNFTAGKIYAELNFLIGYLVANDTARPTWNSGDIFATK